MQTTLSPRKPNILDFFKCYLALVCRESQVQKQLSGQVHLYQREDEDGQESEELLSQNHA